MKTHTHTHKIYIALNRIWLIDQQDLDSMNYSVYLMRMRNGVTYWLVREGLYLILLLRC